MKTKCEVLIMMLCLPFIMTYAASQKETIRLGSGEWPPYTSEKLMHEGVASLLIKEAFALEGVDVTFEYYPWKRTMV